MTQVYYLVVWNKTCRAYACGTDIKASSLQKLEAGSYILRTGGVYSWFRDF